MPEKYIFVKEEFKIFSTLFKYNKYCLHILNAS